MFLIYLQILLVLLFHIFFLVHASLWFLQSISITYSWDWWPYPNHVAIEIQILLAIIQFSFLYLHDCSSKRLCDCNIPLWAEFFFWGFSHLSMDLGGGLLQWEGNVMVLGTRNGIKTSLSASIRNWFLMVQPNELSGIWLLLIYSLHVYSAGCYLTQGLEFCCQKYG